MPTHATTTSPTNAKRRFSGKTYNLKRLPGQVAMFFDFKPMLTSTQILPSLKRAFPPDSEPKLGTLAEEIAKLLQSVKADVIADVLQQMNDADAPTDLPPVKIPRLDPSRKPSAGDVNRLVDDIEGYLNKLL